MKKTKALCVFTTILGNRATAQRIVDALEGMPNLEPTFVMQTVEDYARYPAPRLARLTNAWESRYIARAKIAELQGGPFDILLVNAWEFVIEFQNLARRLPAAALMDAVPSTIDFQLRRRGNGGLRRTMAALLNDVPFSRAVKHFQYFLPMGSDCADALAARYKVPRDHMTVTLAPQDLNFWTPGPKDSAERFRLLFVANDFVRKGGEFLLRLYTEHLASSCTLTIASNDSALESRTLPAGVALRRGSNREAIRQLYRDNDLFVFPTMQDYMPQVLAEALATGLPCIANDVGGIRDLIHDGETGFLMTSEMPPDVWATRIEQLRTDRAELDRLARNARTFAEQKLDALAFARLVTQVAERLGAAGR
jgi:glycosyltransferase involved in cell wall biosynthesis